MRALNVYFDDKEFNALVKAKKKLNWRDFILTLLEDNAENVNIQK